MKNKGSAEHLTPLVSLIIPVYNAETYLRRCLDSAVNQDYSSLEIIVVDDGSTDSTSDILDSYSDHPRLQYWRIENSGPSAARNFGIEKATGDQICFLDADDYIEPNYVSLLIAGKNQVAEDDCLIITEYIDYSPQNPSGTPVRQLPREGQFTVKEFLPYLFEGTMGVLWGKLFSHNIIKTKRLRLSPNISYQEDLVFAFSYLQYCTTVYYRYHTSYHYNRLNDQSLTVKIDLKHADEFKKVQKALLDIAKDSEEKNQILIRAKRFYSQLLYSIGWHSESTKIAKKTIPLLEFRKIATQFKGRAILMPYFRLLSLGQITLALMYIRLLKTIKKILGKG